MEALFKNFRNRMLNIVQIIVNRQIFSIAIFYKAPPAPTEDA
jgi:hypothetical protein